MTTTTTDTTAAPPDAGTRPWQRAGWLPEMQAISWPQLTEARTQHLAALSGIATAKTATDQAKARDRLYDAVESAWQTIMPSITEAEVAVRAARQALAPPLAKGRRLDPEAAEAERGRIREGRGPIEDDERAIRSLALGTFVSDTFAEGGTVVPSCISEVRLSRAANA